MCLFSGDYRIHVTAQLHRVGINKLKSNTNILVSGI